MTVITLTTDFGSGDHEAGVLKGVIWSITPAVQVIDLSHDVAPHAVMEAALLLWRAAPYFPDGSIHVAVVDPGVGTSRRGIAARLASQYFVGPDNGIISMLLSRVEAQNGCVEIVNLDDPDFWLPEVSRVFHGRDIFAPVSAHLAAGIPLNALGPAITDPVRFQIPEPTRTPSGWMGQVIHVDHFGNLSTSLRSSHVGQEKEIIIKIAGKSINRLVATFGELPPSSLVALLDSSGSLAISVVNGNAATYLPAQIGDQVEIVRKG